ncbi:hypothetical protein AB835_03610 [Candidatus Endobugula sertula]|uniref:Uncharacterized protein n=1 Tax=Candidatus Endobugula sertula TaxID=62101 RepID=A0A1D2QS23_9GAMM|nr:hypothetical protein AB835_03610 [Candidatus Endobugula sertula]
MLVAKSAANTPRGLQKSLVGVYTASMLALIKKKVTPVKRETASGVVKMSTVSILGFAANDPRVYQGCSVCCVYDASVKLFAGQYFDEETHLHYNG